MDLIIIYQIIINGEEMVYRKRKRKGNQPNAKKEQGKAIINNYLYS